MLSISLLTPAGLPDFVSVCSGGAVMSPHVAVVFTAARDFNVIFDLNFSM